MKVALVNLSKEVSLEQAKVIAGALEVQANQHAAKAWSWDATTISVASDPKCAEEGAFQLALVDGLDVLGAYGYHSADERGLPYGRVDVAECLAMGGGILRGVNGVSTVASHELLELRGDPTAEVTVGRPDGASVPVELCDACQGFFYYVEFGGLDVAVADFLLPSYFGQIAQPDLSSATNAQVLATLKRVGLHLDAVHLEAAIDDHARLGKDSDDGLRASLVDKLARMRDRCLAAIGAKLAAATFPGPYDYLGSLTTQWEIAPGGYSVVYVDGNATTVYGAKYAARASKTHPTARTARRLEKGR